MQVKIAWILLKIFITKPVTETKSIYLLTLHLLSIFSTLLVLLIMLMIIHYCLSMNNSLAPLFRSYH